MSLPSATGAPQAAAAPAGLRSVHRAVAEARRGAPVLIDGPSPLLAAPVETVSAASLADLLSLSGGQGTILLAPSRAASVLRRPVDPAAPAVALRLNARPPDLGSLRALADPTLDQMLTEPLERVAAPALAQAALSLAKLARLLPAVVSAPATPDSADREASAGLLAVSAADLLGYPTALAAGLRRVAEAEVPLLKARDCRVVAFRAPDLGVEHLAIVVGDPAARPAPLVRIHSECFTGDLLGSLRCDCGAQLHGAIERIGQEGAGVLLYLSQEGRGIGLVNKLRAYAMQDRGLDTLDANRALGWGADERNFLIAATMLRELGIARVRLLTNNPDKIAALAACGVDVVERVKHLYAPNGVNDRYLETKVRRLGHLAG